jgi:hypothetical protein
MTAGVALLLVLALAVPAVAEVDKTPDDTWTANGRVNAVVTVGDRIYLGGAFTEVSNRSGSQVVARNRLAAFDATTGAVVPDWNPGANDEVLALAASEDGSRLFAGGRFTSVGGEQRLRLAAVGTADGAVDRQWVAHASWHVRALEVSGSRLYVGGMFAKIKGVDRLRLAALDTVTSALDPTWAPTADDQVWALKSAPDGSRVYVGGFFRTISGESRDYLAALDPVSGAVSSWRPTAACIRDRNPCNVLDVDADGDHVYAAVAGPGGQLNAYRAGDATRAWRIYADGDVQAVHVRDGLVYAGGHFYKRFGNNPDGSQAVRRRLAAADAVTGAVDAFDPVVETNLGVWTITSTPTHLYIGGDFTSVEGAPQRRFARFADPANAPPAPAGVFADGFESGDLSRWTRAYGSLTAQSEQVFTGAYAARATPEGARAWAWRELPEPYDELYYRLRFRIDARGGGQTYLAKLRRGDGTPLFGLYVGGDGRLGYRNMVAGVNRSSAAPVADGRWYEAQVRVRTGAGGGVDVWLDGAPVAGLSLAEDFGSSPIGRVQLADDGLRTHDLTFDDVAVDTAPVAP